MAEYVNVTFDFGDKIVLVIGGGSGSGLAIANDCARAGATVVVAGRSQVKAHKALSTLPAGRVSAVPRTLATPLT